MLPDWLDALAIGPEIPKGNELLLYRAADAGSKALVWDRTEAYGVSWPFAAELLRRAASLGRVTDPLQHVRKRTVPEPVTVWRRIRRLQVARGCYGRDTAAEMAKLKMELLDAYGVPDFTIGQKRNSGRQLPDIAREDAVALCEEVKPLVEDAQIHRCTWVSETLRLHYPCFSRTELESFVRLPRYRQADRAPLATRLGIDRKQLSEILRVR
jgi:hypothetical protein